MTSSYPGAYDNLPARTDASPATPDAHAADHTDERDAINAIQAELGLDPAGASATVKARLDALDTTVAGKEAAGVAAALVDDLSGVTNQSGARTSLGLGTSATLNVPAAGDAASGEVVKGNDSRLTNSRTPSSHASSHGSAGSDPITIANTQVTGLGSASTKDVPVTGNAASGEAVLGSDTRLTDARTPTAHVHAGADITSGTVDPDRLGTGTSITTKFLRGDSTWQDVASGSVATDTIFDAKGDLPVGTGADTAAKLTVGTNGHMLYADSDEATGLIWRPYRSQAMRYQADDYWLMSRQAGSGYTAVGMSSTAANSNNIATYVAFSIAEPITLKALALHCVGTNAGVNAVVRLGIYNADATTGRPSTVVVDAGTSSINAANVKEIGFTAVTLKPGNYFYVVSAQGLDTAGGNPTFSATQTSTTAFQETAPAASNNMFSNWQTTGVTGAFAANPTVAIATRSTNARCFHVWGKIN